MKIYLGKFSKQYQEQIEKKFYAAGEEGNSWYAGVQPGDFVFVAYEGEIIALWKAREYTQLKNTVNPDNDGVLQFDEVKIFKDISVINNFARYKHFLHDLNLVNKVSKSVKAGFVEISTAVECPKAEDIDFKSGLINVYISLEKVELDYKEGDIRVTIDSLEKMKILGVERYQGGKFIVYEELNRLYEEKNALEGKYSVRELCELALKDQAPNKRRFLLTLIEELEKKGYMKVSNIIRLYDNLLVGRKRTATPKGAAKDRDKVNEQIDEESFDESTEQYLTAANLLNYNPNVILYGPPGTGKTYATEKIIDSFEKKYFHGKGSFEIASAENRVKSITFHQSYSYEEFIEGIRPILKNEEAEGVGYQLENGLFKEFCINAEKEIIKRKENAEYVDMIHSESRIWKISLGERKLDDIFNECINVGEIAIGWLPDHDLTDMDYEEIRLTLGNDSDFGDKPTQNANSINAFVNEMTIGDIVFVYDGQQTTRMIGVIKSGYCYKKEYAYKHRRSVEWFKDLNYPIDIHKYNGYKNLTLKTVYKLGRISVSDVIEIVTNYSNYTQSQEDKREIKPYYMIIDEINRGNIAKIFGELITLIEQDKRGKQKSVLPYSKKEFSVPSNLYIIGTMNTADRSIAAIDTALRRRFTFIEIEPDSSVLSRNENPIINDTVDLTKLLDAINERIMDKYDRDHRIGHAYFMGIETLSNFYQTWYYEILPLLNEYFYNDIDTLKMIVGKSFYDRYGNIKYLTTTQMLENLSEFEKAVISIYQEKENG